MKINYDSKYDLLYVALSDRRGEVITQRVTDDIAVDFDEKGHIVGFEVLAASQHVDLASLLPVSVESR